MNKLSVVVPVYQNAENLMQSVPHYINFLKTLPYSSELICVDDGSTDSSYKILSQLKKTYPENLKVIKLVRNFGQAAAIYAGMSASNADIIGVISADMQDPIELFGEMTKEWESGYKTVIAARADRHDKGLIVYFSKFYNWLLGKMISPKYPKGGFDFFLIDKEVAGHLLEVSERDSMIQVLLLWLGYDFKKIDYIRKERVGGKSQWSFWKRFKLVIDTVTTNSHLPLKSISLIGLSFSAMAFLYAAYAICSALYVIAQGETIQVQGWTSIVVLIAFFSGLILLSLGIIGEYIWRIFNYVQRRPIYLVDDKNKN